MYRSITKCRICSNLNLVKVLDLGEQALTGVFPRKKNQIVTRGPLQLVKCVSSKTSCGLLQLAHSYDLNEMYGESYGYRSGLNPSMVSHLKAKVSQILGIVDLSDNPVVLDIGSNDGTTLSAYPQRSCIRVGMDPTAKNFRSYYPPGVTIIDDFFSSKHFLEAFPNARARVVTSFSMFYDLESPMEFVKEISSILDDNGVWVFEQSYMPTMLERNSYDTVCHEHLEYYGLYQIHWMLSRCDLKIIDLEFNDINGGSVSVTAAKKHSHFTESADVKKVLEREHAAGLDEVFPYINFAQRTKKSRDGIKAFIEQAHKEGKRVGLLGASTKGNVILQYCGITENDVEAVGEINPDKFGAFTPGSLLPIIDETELIERNLDYLLVLPWHFKNYFIKKYPLPKTVLVFPLPTLEFVVSPETL